MKNNSPVSFELYGIFKQKFIPCSIYEARKAVKDRSVVHCLISAWGYGGAWDASHCTTIEKLNSDRANTKLRSINGSPTKHGYFKAVLSHKELENIKNEAEVAELEAKKIKDQEQYDRDVALGKVDYKVNVIYTDGKKGSLSFYLNGKDFRLLGNSSHPEHWDYKKQRHIGANQFEMSVFKKAYANGEFDSIGYKHMDASGMDIYLSTCS